MQDEKNAPLGVIGSITTGFEMIGQRLWLVMLPVAVDLFLWLGPQLSTETLMHRVVRFLQIQAMPNSVTAHQVAQAAQMLNHFGRWFNLVSLLGAVPLLNVPSLIAGRVSEVASPLGPQAIHSVASFPALLGWVGVLIPAGLLLGFLYLNSVARWVRMARSPNRRDSAHDEDVGRVRTAWGKLVRILLFAFGLLAVMGAVGAFWSMVVGTFLVSVPLVGILVWLLGVGLGVYIALHLLFVVPGVLVGERGIWRATWESFVLMQLQGPSVLGLVLIIVVIYKGLGFVWSLPMLDSWSLLVGILGNSCVATGLTAAMFVFYQERIGRLSRLRQAAVNT